MRIIFIIVHLPVQRIFTRESGKRMMLRKKRTIPFFLGFVLRYWNYFGLSGSGLITSCNTNSDTDDVIAKRVKQSHDYKCIVLYEIATLHSQ